MDDYLKLVQIAFYVTVGVVAVLTFIKAKDGLLNSVNAEYKKRVMDRLAVISDELFSEFDHVSENFWAKDNPVKEVLDKLHDQCISHKGEILNKGRMPSGIPASSKETRMIGLLRRYRSDPFIPASIRVVVTDLLEKRVNAMISIFLEEIGDYKNALAQGKHWDDLENNHIWLAKRINKRLAEEGCAINSIENEVHKVREEIRKYLESFDPLLKKR